MSIQKPDLTTPNPSETAETSTRHQLEQLISDLYPPADYHPETRDYERVIPAGGEHHIWIGAFNATLKVLKQDEMFKGNPDYDARGAMIPAGTHVLARRDIAPFGFKDPIDTEALRNKAKLYMTVDFLRMIWKAQELDPALKLTYGTTNPTMAKWQIKHWGFKTEEAT